MNYTHLRHDVAWHAARELVETIAPSWGDDAQAELFMACYRACKDMLANYDLLIQREALFLSPSRN